MATPRKVTKSQPTSDAGRKRWPAEGTPGSDDAARSPGAGAGGTDLVAIVRGLAAAVAEHNLSELVVDTPEATFTLRRGGGGQVTMVPSMGMPSMQMPSMGMPSMQMPSMGMPSMSVPMMPSHGSGHHVPAPAPAVEEEKGHLVTSPFVGTFYRRPNPDSPEYVRLNDRVKKGQVLCIIEAMKLMNEIEADIDGTLVGVLAEDSAPVEYGQPLFKIAP